MFVFSLVHAHLALRGEVVCHHLVFVITALHLRQIDPLITLL